MEGFYGLILILRAVYYPTKEIHGSTLCYLTDFLEPFKDLLAQFQTFFITIFRYLCLYHNQLLLSFNIFPKSLAKITLLFMFLLCTFSALNVVIASETSFTLQSCLGNYVLLYQRNGYAGLHCSQSGSRILNGSCYFFLVTYFVIASNIPEAFLLYKCYTKIQEQTESVHTLIDNISYHRRKR